MLYCYHCRRLTPGEPLFCTFCGRSYDTKLCSRLHPNIRTALVCSQCGSEDLSLPQPEARWWFPLVLLFITTLPGLGLLAFSVWLLVPLAEALFSGFEPFPIAAALVLPLALAWLVYGRSLQAVRNTFARGIRRRQKGVSRHR